MKHMFCSVLFYILKIKALVCNSKHRDKLIESDNILSKSGTKTTTVIVELLMVTDL